MLSTIGNTPLVQLKRLVGRESADVFVKLEYFNPTGSYKDRMAKSILEAAIAREDLTKSITVLECTGGSTGSSLAFLCAALGYPCHIISSDAYAKAKLDSMRAFGAQLDVVPCIGGEVTPDLWPRMLERAEQLQQTGKYFYVQQFQNKDARLGYRDMAQEVLDQVDRPIDLFCGAVGTAGMLSGVGSALREKFPNVRLVALEPDSSAVLSGGQPGSHNIDGTAAGFIPPLYDGKGTEVLALSEAEARVMVSRLAQEEGLFCGTSTGLNVLAAIKLAKELGPGKTVVTVACDSGFKYL